MTGLTEQQARVLRMLCDDRTPAEIRDALDISRYRVRAIIRRLCEIHGASGIHDLVTIAEDDDGRTRVDGGDPAV